MKIQTFIFAHNEKIILDFERTNKFKSFPNLKYVLIGNGDYQNVEMLSNVIISKKYDNIEEYPRFCSYTGWYLLWKNDLIDADYVNLFEYDINILERPNYIIDCIEKSKSDFIGYLPLRIDNQVFIKERHYIDFMVPVIYEKYGVDIENLITNLNQETFWSSTSNSTFEIKTFNKYMEWFHGMFDDLKNNKLVGHAHERSISMFCFINEVKCAYFNDFISHFQLNSHHTSPLETDRFDKQYNTLLNGK